MEAFDRQNILLRGTISEVIALGTLAVLGGGAGVVYAIDQRQPSFCSNTIKQQLSCVQTGTKRPLKGRTFYRSSHKHGTTGYLCFDRAILDCLAV